MATSNAPWPIACSRSSTTLITFIAYLLSGPSEVSSLSHGSIICSLIHHLLPYPSFAPWFIAFNIHCSFHCFPIHRSFDLTLIHPWSIAWPSIAPIISPWSIASWSVSYFLIHRLLPIHHYFNCFLIFQSFNSFIVLPDPSSWSIAFWLLSDRSFDSSLIYQSHLIIARSWSIAPVILYIE
jgi:hypothetical protein